MREPPTYGFHEISSLLVFQTDQNAAVILSTPASLMIIYLYNPIMPTPLRLNLKRDEKLEIQWDDGKLSVYPISLLRTDVYPCAIRAGK